MNLDIREINVRSVLTKSRIPGIDYVVNPYIGCRFGCMYCYASFMGRFIGHKTIADWGNYVFAKVNAPELLTKEVKRLRNHGQGKELFISSVTDPYQGLEAKYQLTRQCLKVLLKAKFQGTLSILTKSPLVTRDLDLLKQFPHVFVGLTITSNDDTISRYFETYAPNVTDRLKTLTTINQARLPSYAFIGPLLPHYVANPTALESVFKAVKSTGTTNIFVEHINLSSYIKNRMIKAMRGVDQGILHTFYQSQDTAYRQDLDRIVNQLVKKYGMHLMTDTTIFHQEYQKQAQPQKLSQLHQS